MERQKCATHSNAAAARRDGGDDPQTSGAQSGGAVMLTERVTAHQRLVIVDLISNDDDTY